LSPGQEVAIEISIRPAGLGIGQLKKSVVFRFADGSLQVAHIVGECLGPEESQGIRVAPTEVYFDFGETPDSQTRQLKVFGKGPIHVAVNNADWISAKVIRQPATEPGIIDVVAEPNGTGSDEDAGMLQVWVVDQEPRLTIPIHATWPKPYKVECRIVTLAKDKEPKSGAFIFRKRGRDVGEIRIDPITCNLSGIQLQPVQNEQENRLEVKITGGGSVASGLHSIDLHIRVGDPVRKPYSERVYVMVR